MIFGRLNYILGRLDEIEEKLDKLDGTLTGLTIKVYELTKESDNGTDRLLGPGTTERSRK